MQKGRGLKVKVKKCKRNKNQYDIKILKVMLRNTKELKGREDSETSK